MLSCFKPCKDQLEPFQDHFGAIQTITDHFGTTSDKFRPHWTVLGQLRSNFGQLLAKLDYLETIWGCLWQFLIISDHFSPFRNHFETILGYWGPFVTTLGPSQAIQDHFGTIWRPLQNVLGSFGPFRTILGPDGAISIQFWGNLDHCRSFWNYSRPTQTTLTYFGTVLSHFGTILGQFGSLSGLFEII